MIRIERDPAFWTAVASHPAVASGLYGIRPDVVGAFATREDVLPLAATHGGYIFARTDPLGLICELHSLFTPEGWGREVVQAGLEALHVLFSAMDYRLLTTLEVAGNARSRPPRRCGFALAGDWRATPMGSFRLWLLTKDAWEASPMFRPPHTIQ